jgi:hypothetical protein
MTAMARRGTPARSNANSRGTAGRALVTTLKWLAEAGIWIIVYVVPLVTLLLGAAIAIRSLIRRIRRRGGSPSNSGPVAV